MKAKTKKILSKKELFSADTIPINNNIPYFRWLMDIEGKECFKRHISMSRNNTEVFKELFKKYQPKYYDKKNNSILQFHLVLDLINQNLINPFK